MTEKVNDPKIKEIIGELSCNDIQEGNYFFSKEAQRTVETLWKASGNNANAITSSYPFPWKTVYGYSTENKNIRHGFLSKRDSNNNRAIFGDNFVTNLNYKYLNYSRSAKSNTFSNATNYYPYTFNIGGIGAYSNKVIDPYYNNDNIFNPIYFSYTEIPKEVTHIGPSYIHPIVQVTSSCSTTAGKGYITITNFNEPYYWTSSNGVMSIFLDTSSANRGFYKVRNYNHNNNRVYLDNLDGTPFKSSVTETISSWYFGCRGYLFNENNIIPLSAGSYEISGKFDPGEDRNSYCFTIYFEKSGAVNPSDPKQKGTYYFSVFPRYSCDSKTEIENSCPSDGFLRVNYAPNSWSDIGTLFDYGCKGLKRYCNGAEVDIKRQRLWWTTTGGSLDQIEYVGGIYWWYTKSIESAHEVATVSSDIPGDVGSLNPPLHLNGTFVGSLNIGSEENGYVWVTLRAGRSNTNAGLVIIEQTDNPTINTPMVTHQYSYSTGDLPYTTYALAVDKSANRKFVDTTVDNIIAGNYIFMYGNNTEHFKASDVGRAIHVDNPENEGTYIIDSVTINSNSSYAYLKNLDGTTPSFTYKASNVSWHIGDRCYLFFNDTTTMANKMVWMDSLNLGTFVYKDVTRTNGNKIYIYNGDASYDNGNPARVSIDQTTGCVYWISNDSTVQINKYDPATNTCSRLQPSDVGTPSGGGGGSLTNFTNFFAIAANPLFDELWVSGDQGFLKLKLSDFTGGDFRRYSGYINDESYYYPNDLQYRSMGISSNNCSNKNSSMIIIAPDGKVIIECGTYGTGTKSLAFYSRDVDNFQEHSRTNFRPYNAAWSTFYVLTKYGDFYGLYFDRLTGIIYSPYEITYQWIDNKWTPKEVCHGPTETWISDPSDAPGDGALPDPETELGCKTKFLHNDAQDLLFGVKIKFSDSAGTSDPNLQFIGRMGLTKPNGASATRVDGSVTAGGNTFTGSNFVASYASSLKYLRVFGNNEACDGIYKISAFNSSTNITVTTLNNETVSWPDTSSSLQYEVWDPGIPGNSAGPENITFTVVDGIGKDPSQTMDGYSYSISMLKSYLREYSDPIKFCFYPPGPEGSDGWRVYSNWYNRATNNYTPSIPAHKALSGEVTEPIKKYALFDGLKQAFLNGNATNANAIKANFFSGSGNGNVNGEYCGITAARTMGNFIDVDFGINVKPSKVIIRGINYGSNSDNCSALYAQGNKNRTTTNGGSAGTIMNLYATNITPVDSSEVRCTGTGLSLTTVATGNEDAFYVNLGSGSFLSTMTYSNTDGESIEESNLFCDLGNYLNENHIGAALKITSGNNPGIYRIIDVIDYNGSSYVKLRLLNQTPFNFSNSESNLSWELYNDSVREEDLITLTGDNNTKLSIERLVSETRAQLRIIPTSTFSNKGWTCYKPTWDLVKRVSYAFDAEPPETKNNGTWVSVDGCENEFNESFKAVIKLNDDYTPSKVGTTGYRYWRFSAISRFNGNSYTQTFFINSMEFYDENGKFIGHTSYDHVDALDDDPNLLTTYITRVDLIQGANTAQSLVNDGLVNINEDKITFADSSNSFLKSTFIILSNESVSLSGNIITVSGNCKFTDSDTNRFILLSNSSDDGWYIITAVTSDTTATVSTIAGEAVSFTGSSATMEIHEGININNTNGDYIKVAGLDIDYRILSISNDYKTITIDNTGKILTNKPFEIRRRALFDNSVKNINPNVTARLIYTETQDGIYPMQPGDIGGSDDSSGYMVFYPNDISREYKKTKSVTVSINGTISGTDCIPEDIGRVFYIPASDNSSNIGYYKIDSCSSGTIKLVSLYTGEDIELNSYSGNLTYILYGERRYRTSRYSYTVRE